MLTKLQSPCEMTPNSFRSWHGPSRTLSNGVVRSRIFSCHLLTIVSRAWSNAGLERCTASPGRDTNTGCSGWSRLCDHAAAVPAVRRVLRASGSVPRQNGGHSSCMQILVRTVQNCAADCGDLTGTVLVMVLNALVGNCGGSAVAVRLGVAQCLVRRWIHVMHHPGWLLGKFHDFLHEVLARLLSSIHFLLFSLKCRAHRRQRQWHVSYWYWRSSRCVPTIAGSLQ